MCRVRPGAPRFTPRAARWLSAALLGLAVNAYAQSYPTKPLRLVVPFAPGGGTDLVGRIVAQKSAEALGQPANELLKSMAGVKIEHVPYKGVAPAATDLMSGQVQMMSGDLSTLLPHVRSGRMRAVAVTSARRSSLLPDVPTIAESGVPGYEASGWFGVLVPAGTPAAIVERLNAAVTKGLAASDARERLAALGGEVASGTPEQFAAHIRAIGLKAGQS